MNEILRQIARNIVVARNAESAHFIDYGSFFDDAYEKSPEYRDKAHSIARAAIEPLLTPTVEMHLAGYEARKKALRCDPDSECMVHYRAMLTTAMGPQP